MSNFSRISILALAFLSACQTRPDAWGTGPLTISPNVQLSYQNYLDYQDPIAFLVTEDGSSSFLTHCPVSGEFRCETDFGHFKALKNCQERLGKACKVFAEGRNIVWEGPIRYASLGKEPVSAATIKWGENIALYGLKAEDGGGGTKRLLGKIQNKSCEGTLNFHAASWQIKCGEDMHAKGSLSKSENNKWGGLGYGNKSEIVRLFVTDDVALARGAPQTNPSPLPPEPEAKSAAPAVRSSQASKMTRPIAFHWDGYTSLAAGTVTLEEAGQSGRIAISLPASEATCEGRYEYGTSAKGTWALACSNGLAASGTFTGLGAGKGSVGNGTDTKGRNVKFTVAAEK